MAFKKKPKVVEKKLGKEKAAGQMNYTDNIIEIDPRQASKDYLDTLLHEHLHAIVPTWDETKIVWWANRLSTFLWEQNYRKVNL